MTDDSRTRVERLLAAARRLADRSDPLGRAARSELPRSTGLSPEGVDFALVHCLELEPSEADLLAFLGASPPVEAAHVLLSSNVFVAAHRAIGLGLAASPNVTVRPSRREPRMVALLSRAAPGLFSVRDSLRPAPGHLVDAYGTAATLSRLDAALPAGVKLRAHGPGFGAVALHAEAIGDLEAERELAEGIALDTSLFDQRGCLSPRVILVEGPRQVAVRLAETLSEALLSRAQVLPLGRFSPGELADRTRYRDTLRYTGDLFEAGGGYVGVAAPEAPFSIAPVGRCLHLIPSENAAARLGEVTPQLTCLASAGPAAFLERVRKRAPRARHTSVGNMQRPALDGPVDRRVDPRGSAFRT